MTTSLDSALYWCSIGVSVLPCGYRSKSPDFGALKRVGSTDKNGRAIWQTYAERLPTTEELKAWFSTSLRNLAVITGRVTILDFDTLQAFNDWQRWRKIETYMVRTLRGIHAYFLLENPPGTSLKLNGIDVKAAGGYCLAPPSLHPSGTRYTPIQGEIARYGSLDDLLPAHLLEDAKPLLNYSLNESLRETVEDSPWNIQGNGLAAHIKTSVKILDFFPNARSTSQDGRWYAVLCPFHGDKHSSGWIDTQRNRYGCHSCINGSISSIDVYTKLKNVSHTEAIRELAR